MASTNAMYTGLSGMNANARRLDVIGNNIANANTTAYKSSSMYFETQFSRTLSNGTRPDTDDGGTNPYQIGLGVKIAGTTRDFNPGSISATGNGRDMAIDGKGFFIVNRGSEQFFTRAGTFVQDAQNNLVTLSGERVQGYGVDSNFNITGTLTDIQIPLGSLKIAEATRNVQFAGNLKADGAVATQGSLLTLGSSASAGFSLVPSATVPATPPNLLETGSLLREIADPQAPAAPLFATGQIIELKGAQKGSRTLPPERYTITAGSTVQDLMNFLRDAMGLNASAGPNPDGKTPGLSLDSLTGQFTMTGNIGTVNDLKVDASDIRVLDSAGAFLRAPFVVDKQADATGESVRTSFVVYDSLGSPVTTDLTMVLDSKGNSGTGWRYFVDSSDDTDLSANVATGLINFDTGGRLSSSPQIPITIDRAGTGAVTPLAINLDFASGPDTLTALASQRSELAATSQDGSPLGTLTAFGVGADGVIIGSFDNGVTRPLGQLALATFTNQEGLVDAGDNSFRAGPNSGNPVITTPGDFGTGAIVSGALELSNVDLGKEFIDMIVTSTGYTASSRVIRTADELLQQLLVLGR